jgi:DNA invertase Pin-like site-specific DNA recombinase
VARNVLLGYGRRSEVRNAIDEINVERQHSRIVAEANARGFTLEWFEDAEGHRSGRHEEGRPGWLSLKSQLDRDDVVGIIVESLSRATRSVRDLHNLVHELENRDLILLSLKEQIDTSTAMGRAFVGFVAIMNQLESDLASERMAANISYKRMERGRHWGLTPFGCAREGTDFVLVPTKEGATVDGVFRGYHEALQKCYEWFADGQFSFSELTDRLNNAGYRFRDRNGKPRIFNEQDVRRILSAHPIYAGNVILGRAKDRKNGEEIYKGSHAPIIPVELCQSVATQLIARAIYGEKINAHRSPGRTYLLSEILYCSACGKRLVGMYQDGNQWYRHDRAKRNCPAKSMVKAIVIEAQVIERLGQFQMPEQLKARIQFLARQMVKEQGKPEWQEARATLKRLDNKLKTLKEMRIEGEITKSEYEQRKKEIESQRNMAQRIAQQAPSDVRQIEDLLAKIDQIAEIIREGEPEQKKKLIATLFERVEQRDGTVTLVLPRAWAQPFFNGNGAHMDN